MVGSDRERHSRLRKIFSHGFSAQAMIDQEPTFRHYTSLLIDRLKEATAANEVQDMTAWYNWATFDMIGDLTFGEPFGCLEESRYHHWVKLLFKHIKGIAISTALIRYPFADTFIKLMTPKNVARDIQTHWQYTESQVAKRLAFKDGRPDFMESIIRSQKNGVSHSDLERVAMCQFYLSKLRTRKFSTTLIR
jgi:cytochrome P450